MEKQVLSGNLSEDEKEAFEVICKDYSIDEKEAKGVGYFNRLLKLCSLVPTDIKIDYTNNSFEVTLPAVVVKVQEEVLEDVEEELEEEEEDDAVVEVFQQAPEPIKVKVEVKPTTSSDDDWD